MAGTLKIGKRFPGRKSSGTFSVSNSASIKPRAAATSSVSTICNVFCCVLTPPACWRCAG